MARHIDVIRHFATGRVQLGHIKFKYIVGRMNVAVVLTKALFRPLLEQHQAALGLRHIC